MPFFAVDAFYETRRGNVRAPDSLTLEALPVSGELQIREEMPRGERDAAE